MGKSYCCVSFLSGIVLKHKINNPETYTTYLDKDHSTIQVAQQAKYTERSQIFGLMLNGLVNNFSVMLGRRHRFLGITSTFGG